MYFDGISLDIKKSVIYIYFSFVQLESMSQPELASRLTLTCMNCYVQPQKLHDIPITIIDVSNKNIFCETIIHSIT